MERVARIELASSAWKAEVLPLNYTREAEISCCSRRITPGGGGWIRTTEAYASDLQSDPFGHSGTPPKRGARFCLWYYPLSIDFGYFRLGTKKPFGLRPSHEVASLDFFEIPADLHVWPSAKPRSCLSGFLRNPCRPSCLAFGQATKLPLWISSKSLPTFMFGLRPSHEVGAATKSRTRDPLITNQLLYQLSYSGVHFRMPIGQARCGF